MKDEATNPVIASEAKSLPHFVVEIASSSHCVGTPRNDWITN